MSSLKLISPAECEFFAEEEIIRIMSGVNFAKLRFISGTFGPIGAGEPADVPLWFAIELRRKGKCTIVMPDWMSPDNLTSVLAKERNSGSFVDLPYHYIEIAKLLLTNAKEDIESPDKVAVLIQDIENVRMAKLKNGCHKVAENIINENMSLNKLDITDISALEIFAVKGFLVDTLDAQTKLFSQVSSIAGGGGGGSASSRSYARLGEGGGADSGTNIRREGPLRRLRDN
jgi:GINS complex subunit 2